MSNWIPVKEKLPDPWVEVITTYKYRGKEFVKAAEYSGQTDEDGNPLFFAFSDECETIIDRFIYTAWMPLPEPYKVESEE